MDHHSSPSLEERVTVAPYRKEALLKGWVVDTSSRILFYVPVIGLWEALVAGMNSKEVFVSRSLAVLFNVLGIGKAHTLCRKYLAKITSTTPASSSLRKSMVDFSAGFLVGFTSYLGILYSAGVSVEEAATATPFALAYNCLTGNFYGKFNDWYRARFGFQPILNR
ncbi:L-alanine exporter AlaE [Candidatus Woesearchaeota archaeon]|nr:L-alanine exporter AlaE [Candidatus Woesearchaeota archaeon]